MKYPAAAINMPGGRPLPRYCRGAVTATPHMIVATCSGEASGAQDIGRAGGRSPVAGPLRATAQARDLPGQAPGPPTP